MPATVFSALVQARVYPDPYFGTNLRSVAGYRYPIGVNFSNVPMPADSPFAKSWWFRTTFQLPADYRGKTLWLNLDGINFRANVWLNGKQIAASDKLAGAWRLFEFDVTAAAKTGGATRSPSRSSRRNPAISPSRSSIGIRCRRTRAWACGATSGSPPPVRSRSAIRSSPRTSPVRRAQLTVRAELTNATGARVDGVLEGQIETTEFSQTVHLAPHETQGGPPGTGERRNAAPVVAHAGRAAESLPARSQFEAGGKVSDTSHTEFGIREVTSEVDAQGTACSTSTARTS